jgi:molecular chaperone GrpE
MQAIHARIVEENQLSKEETPQVTEGEVAETLEQNGVAADSQGELSEEQQSLADQLAAAKREAQQNLEGRQRTLAEFQNYKKRVERELAERYQTASLDTVAKLFPIIDDFERGLANIPEDFSGHSWLEGITLIQRKFQKLLDDYEVVAIDPVGEVFDPSLHEAVGVDTDTDAKSGHVTVTLQKGYLCGDRVLRPAMVRVAG